jgi:hypothetical protein
MDQSMNTPRPDLGTPKAGLLLDQSQPEKQPKKKNCLKQLAFWGIIK